MSVFDFDFRRQPVAISPEQIRLQQALQSLGSGRGSIKTQPVPLPGLPQPVSPSNKQGEKQNDQGLGALGSLLGNSAKDFSLENFKAENNLNPQGIQPGGSLGTTATSQGLDASVWQPSNVNAGNAAGSAASGGGGFFDGLFNLFGS